MYQYLTPKYFRNFSCKKDLCRHSCCCGWQIALSKEEYYRLLNMDCSKILNDKLQNAFTIPKIANDQCYRYINFNWLGNCYMQDNVLCLIHLEKGQSYLPKVCNLYPKSYKTINDINIVNCSNSCEKTLEMLCNPDIFEFEKTMIDIKPEIQFSFEDDQLINLKIYIN